MQNTLVKQQFYNSTEFSMALTLVLSHMLSTPEFLSTIQASVLVKLQKWKIAKTTKSN